MALISVSVTALTLLDFHAIGTSQFLKNKSDLKHEVIPWVKLLKKKTGVDIKIIRCDNSGENKSLQESIDADAELKSQEQGTMETYGPEDYEDTVSGRQS